MDRAVSVGWGTRENTGSSPAKCPLKTWSFVEWLKVSYMSLYSWALDEGVIPFHQK